ncbi:MIT (microtubule interacting and transport) domain [Ceratobasidium sp. AG-Ba]|nr:MIT (microtubule interacting and transport) domain [Ceratobasidium sp. AG-Ba]QRW14877.1 MIT (microtubule interacting and transport) domain [Ceratobasidium sp. AG-Ba]
MPSKGPKVSVRSILGNALALANQAVELDNQGYPEYRRAIMGYAKCIELLNQVLERFPKDGDSSQNEEAERVKAIRDTYSIRMKILAVQMGKTVQEVLEQMQGNLNGLSASANLPREVSTGSALDYKHSSSTTHSEVYSLNKSQESDAGGIDLEGGNLTMSRTKKASFGLLLTIVVLSCLLTVIMKYGTGVLY